MLPGGSSFSGTCQHLAVSGTSRFGTGRVRVPCTALQLPTLHQTIVPQRPSLYNARLPVGFMAWELLGVCRDMHGRGLVPVSATLAAAKCVERCSLGLCNVAWR